MTNTLTRHDGRSRIPALSGMGTIAVGDTVRVRGDRRIWTIVGVSHLRTGIILTIEHVTLVTRERTQLHTSYLNCTKA